MSVINWGIIGLGKIAYQFASAFSKVKNSKLLSVASNNIERLDKFQNDFNLDKKFCYNNYYELLLNNNIDIVYIALPHNLHFEWIVNSIEHKKNILIEKPATINSSEIININQLLDENKIFFAEGFMYRFHPQTLELVNMIKQNEIGELNNMISFFGNNFVEKRNLFGFKKIKIDKKNRLFQKHLGGGSILDLGCYPSSLSILIARLISDKLIKEIKLSNTERYIGPTDVDLEAFTNLIFLDQFTAKIGSSFKSDLGKETKIFGSKGKITIPDTWHCENSKIILNGKEFLIKTKYKNIFSYEIESISNSIINNNLNPDYPAINRKDTEININILDRWINQNEK